MSAISVNLHGPLTASSHAMSSPSYGTIGVIKVSSPDRGEVDLTIFAPSPEAGAAIADAINAAWPVEVCKAEAA